MLDIVLLIMLLTLMLINADHNVDDKVTHNDNFTRSYEGIYQFEQGV